MDKIHPEDFLNVSVENVEDYSQLLASGSQFCRYESQGEHRGRQAVSIHPNTFTQNDRKNDSLSQQDDDTWQIILEKKHHQVGPDLQVEVNEDPNFIYDLDHSNAYKWDDLVVNDVDRLQQEWIEFEHWPDVIKNLKKVKSMLELWLPFSNLLTGGTYFLRKIWKMLTHLKKK